MSIGGRISIRKIAIRLSIGRAAVYKMLEEHVIPAIRLGKRWLVTRHAYLAWERGCGRENIQTDTTNLAV